MTKAKNHNWNQEDLTIAYYYAKFGTAQLGMGEEGLATVIGSTKASLIKQAANFRDCLGIDGFKLKNSSTKKCETCDLLENKTITQVRAMVLATIESRSDILEAKQRKAENKTANERRDELNAQSQKNFENKMQLYKDMGKKLTRIVK